MRAATTRMIQKGAARASAAATPARARAARQMHSSSAVAAAPLLQARASSSTAVHGGRRWLSMLAGSAVLLAAAYELRPEVAAAAPDSGLTPKAWTPLKLVKRTRYNHNTDIFTFALPDPSASLDLPVSSFVLTRCTGADGKDVIRPYTPIDQSERGVVTLLVKDYEKGVMSRHIHNLKVGDSLDIKGPMPKKAYKANEYAQIGMVAGGTGITPCLQVLDEIVANPSDKTQVSVVVANVTPADILLKERFDQLAQQKRVKVTYVVDKVAAGEKFNGPVGHVNADLLKKTLPKPADDTLVYVCGPPGFMNAVSGNKNMKDYSQGELSGALKELGFTEKNVFKF